MRVMAKGLVGMGAALLLAGAAQADGVSLNAVRVGATDSPALAKFYAAAFGANPDARECAADGQ